MNDRIRGCLRRFWCDDGIYLAVMAAFFALRFGPALGRGELFDPFRDNVWLYGCTFSSASAIALTGQFPYWIDTLLGGFPLYQTPHFSATYPFYFFGLLNYGNALQVLYTLTHLACFHILILYLNLYAMIRVAGAKGFASFCGATIGLISGNTAVYAGWLTIAAAWSWFPLLIAGMIRLVRAPLLLSNIALVAIAAALLCTASPSQPVIQAAFFAALFSAAALAWSWRTNGTLAVGRLLLGLAISGAVAGALAGVAVVPMAMATGEMIRHVGNHPPLIGHASLPWESFNVSQLQPHQVTHLLFDSSELGVTGGIYLGPFALLGLTLCVIAYRRSDSFGRFLLSTFALLALYFLLAGFGTHFGLAYLHFHIPLLNRIREASRYLVIFTTLACLLAGIGVQVLVDMVASRITLTGTWRSYFYAATGLSALVFVTAVIVDRSRMSNWLVFAVVPVAVFLLPGGRERLACIVLLIVACTASMLARVGTRPFSVSEYLRPDNLASHRVLARLAQIPDVRDYRVVIVDKQLSPFTWADNASFYGIRSFYMRFTPVPLQQFNEMFEDWRLDLRKLRGAKYFICAETDTPTDPDAKLLFTESGYSVYEGSGAMAPFGLFHAAKLFNDANSFHRALEHNFDYQHAAALSQWTLRVPEVVALVKTNDTSAPPGELVTRIRRTANLIAIASYSSRPGLLVLNERWNKDWHARVDSHPVGLLPANFVQPAVALPAGRHYVEFEYKPMLFWYLLVVQRVAFLVLVLLLAVRLAGRNGEDLGPAHLWWWKTRFISGTPTQP